MSHAYKHLYCLYSVLLFLLTVVLNLHYANPWGYLEQVQGVHQRAKNKNLTAIASIDVLLLISRSMTCELTFLQRMHRAQHSIVLTEIKRLE